MYGCWWLDSTLHWINSRVTCLLLIGRKKKQKTKNMALFWWRASTIAHPYWPAPCSMQWSSDQIFGFMMGCFFFYVCKPIFFFLKKEKHVPFCWDNHFDYGLRQSLYMKSHQIINIECEYCYKGNRWKYWKMHYKKCNRQQRSTSDTGIIYQKTTTPCNTEHFPTY